MIPIARRIWKALPVPARMREIVSPLAFKALDAIRRPALPPRPALEAITPGPLIVSGMLDEVLGLSRAARLTAEALDAAGLAPVRHDLRRLQMAATRETPLPAPGPGGVWLMHCNAPEASVALHLVAPADWSRRYMIGYWAWELGDLPRDWRPVAKRFHEIWAPSRFVADAIAPYADHVRVMPHPLPDISAARRDRARFGFPEDTFVFCALADGRSTFARKNPLGAALAYRRAFPEPDGSTRLVLKLVQPGADPQGMRALTAAIEGRDDIAILEQDLTDAEMLSFLASADALVSLHRSEGFGLAIAEMLALGRPAVATDWSGNVDFMQGVHAQTLVRCTMVPVSDPTGRYRGGVWAEPDLDHAAELLRRVVRDPALRQAYADAAPTIAEQLNAPWARANLEQLPFAAKLFRKDADAAVVD